MKLTIEKMATEAVARRMVGLETADRAYEFVYDEYVRTAEDITKLNKWYQEEKKKVELRFVEEVKEIDRLYKNGAFE